MPPDSTLARLPLPEDILRGRVAVVTGAAGGVGAEIARAFGQFGARVVVADIAEQGRRVAAQIEADGGTAGYVPTNIADLESVAALTDSVRREHGHVDILVNNAHCAPVLSMLEMGVETFDEAVDVNLRGPFLAMKAFLPEMVERGDGTIVNMVEGSARPYLAAFAATKRAVGGLTESLAPEIGEQGVRAVGFEPGLVDTPATRDRAEKLAPRIGARPADITDRSPHPAYPEAMPVEDAAAAAVYLVAELADELHGEVTDGYEVLERAGLITAPTDPAPADPAHPREEAERPGELAGAVCELIGSATEAFEQLPPELRPFARQGFESKAGMPLSEWEAAAERLRRLVERAHRGDSAAASTLREERTRWVEQLGHLVEYARQVPRETAHHVDDAETLEEVTRTMAEKEGAIRQLIETIDQLADRR